MVIDVDGFRIGKKFYPRELGVSSLTQNTTKSYRFNLTELSKIMTSKDWYNAHYCTNYIHGLTFKPVPGERDTYPEDWIKPLIQFLYDENKRNDQYVVAYKGGTIEKDYLFELEIPTVNLEFFGCPKYNSLPEPPIPNCGFHQKTILHCPKKETFAFAEWYKNNITLCTLNFNQDWRSLFYA